MAILLYLGARLKGLIKVIAGFFIYVLFALVLFSPMFLMIENPHRNPAEGGSWGLLLFAIACFLVSASWATRYVFKEKINDLRKKCGQSS